MEEAVIEAYRGGREERKEKYRGTEVESVQGKGRGEIGGIDVCKLNERQGNTNRKSLPHFCYSPDL